MKRLAWRPMALADRNATMSHLAHDNPAAAVEPDQTFGVKAGNARPRPKRYKPGRVNGRRETVVRPNCVRACRRVGDGTKVRRVLYEAQQGP